jgi:glycine cleavage system H protein
MDALEAPGGIRIPTNRSYSRDHLWILPEPDRPRHYRIGLSAYACRYGIEVFFIEDLAAPGTAADLRTPLGLVETEKAIVTLYAPFPCTVVERNEKLLEDPTIITFDGYGAGWIYVLECGVRSAECGVLLTPEAYVAFLQTLPPPQCFVPPA